MTGGGDRIFERRGKAVDGGSGTPNSEKIDPNIESPNLNLKPEITETPSSSSKITKQPSNSTVECDFYTQAIKSLSFRSPYPPKENPAPSESISGSGKRHKNKSSTRGRPRGSNIWVDNAEYFRETTVEDIERLEWGSRVGLSVEDTRFLIPSLDVDDSSLARFHELNRMIGRACENDSFSSGGNGEAREDNGQSPVDVDVDERTTRDLQIEKERSGRKSESSDGKDQNVRMESLSDVTDEMLTDPKQHKDNSANDSPRVEGELSRVMAKSAQMTTVMNVEGLPNSYIHPITYNTLMKANKYVLEKSESDHSASVRENSHLEASSSSGLCCNNDNMQATSGDWSSRCKGVSIDQMLKARNMRMVKLSPADEVEGELLYYQNRILNNAVARKCKSDDLISKVARSLPLEIDAAGKQKGDAVLVSQYSHELMEAKKLGRKERLRKEAQDLLVASSLRKDTLEEHTNQEDLLKMNISDVSPGVRIKINPRERNTVSRPSLDGNFEPSDNANEHGRICEICRRSETDLNPILVCFSCKVSVHMNCYYSGKSTTGPWRCELCEYLFSSQDSGTLEPSFCEKPNFVAECGLCGGYASPFRKSVDGQWIHAFCAEWVLESTYRRGQVNPVQAMETVSKGNDTCILCHRKIGVCLKCSYGQCQSTFHPTCARTADFYMNVRTSSGDLQHQAYCKKHSLEQRVKAGGREHKIEEFNSLKLIRVEFERLRLLCERIIKREKLKRELVLCSHDILASNRDTALSALAHHPFYQP